MNARGVALLLAMALTSGCAGPSPSGSVGVPASTSGATQPSSPAAAIPAATILCAGHDRTEHVYHPDRLRLLDPCKTVTGVVATLRREADGDIHIGLRLDSGQESLVDATNVSGQGGNLVLEIICAGTVTRADAVSACASYTNPIREPALDAHITATGPYVLDLDHGWNEIHPVWSITVVPLGAAMSTPATAVPTVASTPAPALPPASAPTPAIPPTPAPTPVAVNLCGAPSNPWNYTFCGGSLITAPPGSFCSYFSCIASFWNGVGYVIQCQDLTLSKSGGRSGSCSQHGGNYRPLYAP